MGFLTSKERFVGRREAYKIALACGQIKPHIHKSDPALDKMLSITKKLTDKDFEWLASEDLY